MRLELEINQHVSGLRPPEVFGELPNESGEYKTMYGKLTVNTNGLSDNRPSLLICGEITNDSPKRVFISKDHDRGSVSIKNGNRITVNL